MASSYKAPDVKGPRHRVSSDISLLSYESYAEFKKRTKVRQKQIPRLVRSSIIKAINKKSVELVLSGNYNVRFPRLGLLHLTRWKQKVAMIDMPASIKFGEIIRQKPVEDFKINLDLNYGSTRDIMNLRVFRFSSVREVNRKFKKKAQAGKYKF